MLLMFYDYIKSILKFYEVMKGQLRVIKNADLRKSGDWKIITIECESIMIKFGWKSLIQIYNYYDRKS